MSFQQSKILFSGAPQNDEIEYSRFNKMNEMLDSLVIPKSLGAYVEKDVDATKAQLVRRQKIGFFSKILCGSEFELKF